MQEIPLNLPGVDCRALIERGMLARAGELLRASPTLRRASGVFVITAAPVRGPWGGALEASLARGGFVPTVLELPDGERAKSLAHLEPLAEDMVAAGADRDALVIAFGGGVVGDVAALLASLYMRGVALVQIPTTLVAMIDSSLGGKTGVNLAGGKNLLGSFHHPQLILVDPDLLSTLPEREYRSGLAEAVKYGIIGDVALFNFMDAETGALRRREPSALETIIAAGLRQKAAVVASDVREADRRRILNFGHTLGHALESATGYGRFLHGEAVAWGMIAANAIAVRRGLLGSDLAARMDAVIMNLCGPLPPVAIPPEVLLRHARSDKKARQGVLHFVLARSIGEVEVVAGVSDEDVLAALRASGVYLPRLA